MKARPYSPADADVWDRIVGDAPMGTFLHTRRFLSYHGERFREASLVIEDNRGRPIGVLPAARTSGGQPSVSSHPGSTVGGLVHTETISASETSDMLIAVLDYYRGEGMDDLLYKSVPPHLMAKPCSADLYAIWQAGGQIVRRDLWNVIDLTQPRKPRMAQMRRRQMRKAIDAGLRVQEDNSDDAVRQFHAILSRNLDDRHHVKPVHEASEMIHLRERFPDRICLWLVRDQVDRPIAGSWVFMHPGRAWHTQYIAADQAGRQLAATDRLFEVLIEQAKAANARYLSLGASTEQEGQVLNSGLFDFKASFGFGSIVQDFYRLDLQVTRDGA